MCMTNKMNLLPNEKGDHSQDPDGDNIQKPFFQSRSSHLKVNNNMKWDRIVPISLLSLAVGFMLAIEFSSPNNVSTTTAFHREFNTIRGDSSIDGDTRKGHWPRIAWLMTFPNSGTSFTNAMIRSVTERDTGTNYKHEGGLDNAKPIHAESPNGPFWSMSWNATNGVETPNTYVLTKTHCGGRCGTCGPSQYVENPHSFLLRCRSTGAADSPTYDASLVHKSVHLIRNPFDNIVSRFHHARKQFVKNNETEKLNLYSYSKEGFRNYCSMVNDKVSEDDGAEITRFTGSSIMDAMKSIPCYHDFFRYVQWHNLAFVTTDDLGIPAHLLHYEDYADNFNQTVNDLLSFLELEWRGKNIEFVKGKQYSKYFTLKEQKTIASALKELSSKKTWNNIGHYFTFSETI